MSAMSGFRAVAPHAVYLVLAYVNNGNPGVAPPEIKLSSPYLRVVRYHKFYNHFAR